MNCLLVLLALLGSSYAQKLVELSSFRGSNVRNPIDGSGQFSIYVSAFSDDDSILKQIRVVTDDRKEVTLYDLKNKKLLRTTGLLQPYPILTTAYLTTTLSDDVMKKLTGVMFISTTKQMNDGSFYVIDVDGTQIQSTYALAQNSATLLFLNTNTAQTVPKSSLFTSWKQEEKATVSMYQGVPSDGAEPKSTQIFSNPMQLSYNSPSFGQYFPKVEKFSLASTAFYLKTYAGVQFSIGFGHYKVDGTRTTALTTTGFYQKSINEPDASVKVYTERNNQYSGMTGANTVGNNFPSGAKVEVGQWDGASSDSTSFPPTSTIFFWNSPKIGQDFRISSTGAKGGEFFVQYFVLQGTNSQTTAPGAPTLAPATWQPEHPTQKHVEATTKSSGSVKLCVSLLIMLIGCIY